MCHLRAWFSGELGSVKLTVGLNDLKGVFQHWLFYKSILKRHKNYQKEEIEEGEAQDVDRSCKGAVDWGWESGHMPAMFYAGKAGKIRRKLKIRITFMKRQDDTFSIS